MGNGALGGVRNIGGDGREVPADAKFGYACLWEGAFVRNGTGTLTTGVTGQEGND